MKKVRLDCRVSLMISGIKHRVAEASRRKRATLFHSALQPEPTASLIDLGGGKGRHLAEFLPQMRNATIADFNPAALAHARTVYGFKTRLVDGSEILPFADQEFDIVFCSSVIEHVTGEKAAAVERFKRDGAAFRREAWRHQVQFASELRRIGRRYFVQTPNRFFPVEVHSWIPLIGVLPTHWQWLVIRVFNRFWPRKDENPDWALLSYREMVELFPDATIHRERFMGLTKSIIAVGHGEAGRAPRREHPAVEAAAVEAPIA